VRKPIAAAIGLVRAITAASPAARALAGAIRRPLGAMLARAGAALPALPSDAEDPAAYARWVAAYDVGDLGPEADLPAGWVMLSPDDVLIRPGAVALARAALEADPQLDLIYGDEDVLPPGGARRDPWFKPDWTPEPAFGGQDMVGGGFAMARASALAAAGPLAPGREALDLALRLPPTRIGHIPRILAHRAGPASTQGLAPLAARHAGAPAVASPYGGFRIDWPQPQPSPLVSVIVPTRDRADLLARCAKGVLEQTDYSPLELLIVDNGSVEAATLALFERLKTDRRVRVIPAPGPFNYSALNNAAAAQARGEILLLLNNDIEVTGGGWLGELVAQVSRPGVGAVGARLLFADGRLQHAGIVAGAGGIASYYHPYAARSARGYRDALVMVREVSAVTGACLAIRREAFEAVGGLEAERLAVAFNDVDLCLRLREAGWRILWTPFAELIHHESATRGSDLAPEHRARYAAEIAHMQRRWGTMLSTDPFYNHNFSLENGAYRLARRPPGLNRRASAPEQRG
jgi:GT2 family glycosyltransferase